MKTTYNIDPAHSSAQFSVRHLMISNVRGSFGSVKGTVVYDPDSPADSSIEAEIDASTISSMDQQRDAHLKAGISWKWRSTRRSHSKARRWSLRARTNIKSLETLRFTVSVEK